jgi:hypothetical protein
LDKIYEILKKNAKIREQNKENLLLLLLCRTFQDENVFSKDNLPLDMFKEILKAARILFLIPKNILLENI